MASESRQDAGIPPAPTYSKDYWDLVFEQLGRRPLFRIGMAVLAVLYASAIYAPLIANDRPYVLDAVNYKEYDSSLRTLRSVASVIEKRVTQTPEQYLETRTSTAQPTLAEAIEVQHGALRMRTETLFRFLPEDHHARVSELESLIDEAIAANRSGELAAAGAKAEEAKALASAMRKDLKVEKPEIDPDTGAAIYSGGGAGSITLVSQASYPLLESISPYEIFFMVLWALLLLWPVWNRLTNRVLLRGDRDAIRRSRRYKLLVPLLLGVSSSLLWALSFGSGGGVFEVAPYKAGITSGDIVLKSKPLMPPIAVGYAETHPEEMFRPPTWVSYSEIDERGDYVRGARKAKLDPGTGMMPPLTPVEVRYGEPASNSPWRHPAGTDELGRDFLVRMLWGGRVSLSVGILSAFLLTIIGVVIGSCAGYFGGWVDIAVMRLIEILQSIPALFLILFAMAFTDPEVVPPIVMIVVVIAVIRWTGVARLVRGEFLRLREQEFVLAAQALGFSNRHTIFRHVLPNAMSPVLVSAAFAVAAGILTESIISFLGFGIRHPGASWGSLINESKSAEHWWVQVFPGSLIFVTVTCYNLVGDAVRDALDPKMKV